MEVSFFFGNRSFWKKLYCALELNFFFYCFVYIHNKIEFYKSATRRNFEIRKSEHVTEKVDGIWGTTTYVGPLTWSCAIVAAPTIIGFFLILLFFPMDERDVYYSNGRLYTADGYFYKSATEKNFQLTKSQHLKL